MTPSTPQGDFEIVQRGIGNGSSDDAHAARVALDRLREREAQLTSLEQQAWSKAQYELDRAEAAEARVKELADVLRDLKDFNGDWYEVQQIARRALGEE